MPEQTQIQADQSQVHTRQHEAAQVSESDAKEGLAPPAFALDNRIGVPLAEEKAAAAVATAPRTAEPFQLSPPSQDTGDAQKAAPRQAQAPKANKIQDKPQAAEEKTEEESTKAENKLTDSKLSAPETGEEGQESGGEETATEVAAPEAGGDEAEAKQTEEPQEETAEEEPKAEKPKEEVAAEGGGEGEGGPAAEGEAPAETPPSAEEDPNFQAVKGRAKKQGKAQRSHAPAATHAGAAQSAAVSPESEHVSKAQNVQMGELETAEEPAFDKAAFKAKLMKQIEKTAPKNLEEADNFKSNNKIGQVKGEMNQMVNEGKEKSQGPTAEKSKEAPDTGKVEKREAETLEPQDPGPPPPSISAKQAVPPARPKSVVEKPIQEGSASLDKEMADAEVSEEQLQKGNEPSFNQALSSKKDAQTDAQKAPGLARSHEQGQIDGAKGDADAAAQTQLTAMHGDRSGVLAQVGGSQQATKSKDEQKRAEIAAHIDGIYQNTKSQVEATLKTLDEDVAKTFDEGANAAKKTFEDYVSKRMSAYKKRRYSGIRGKIRWASDKVFGMPDAVNVFYEEGRNLYLSEMNKVIDQVVDIIATGLTTAKELVTAGRAEVDAYVASLPNDLQQIGQEAANEMQSKFDMLNSQINSKQDQLITDLAQKYNKRLEAIDARIEELKAANAGLVDKAIGFIKKVIATIRKLKDMILNVLAKAASVIKSIIKDPIGFLGNLIKGIGAGLSKFVSNLWTHLKAGFMGWLTGSLGGVINLAGLDVFSLPGIFSLVMQVLGLGWDFIRQKAVKLLGEKVVGAIETGLDIFQKIRTGGLGALWEFIKEKLNDLKGMVIDQIKDLLMTQVIEAGIKWLMGLLNPAGAFIKACMLIYDIVMFFVTKGSQIFELVNAILDSIAAVVGGNVSAMATKIEAAIAKSLPVIIGFLASLLGVSGIADKVKGIIQAIRAKINMAVDWLLEKVKALAGKFLGMLGFGKKGDEKKPEDKEGKKEDGYDADLDEISVSFTDETGEGHRVYFQGDNEKAKLMVASTPTSAKELIGNLKAKEGEKPGVIGNIEDLLKQILSKKQQIVSGAERNEDENNKLRKEIEKLVSDLGDEFAKTTIEGEGGQNEEMEKLTLTFKNIKEPVDVITVEYKRQLKEQETAVNNMKIAKWLSNRYSFEANEGRLNDKNLRAKQQRDLGEDYEKFKESEAEKFEIFQEEERKKGNDDYIIEELWKIRLEDMWNDKLAATHRLDQVAGGDHDVFSGLGNSQVNSHIGSQWKWKVPEIVERVNEVKPSKYNETNMKLELILN